MTGEHEVRDEAEERRDAVVQQGTVDATAQDADDDEDVDAHIWRAQT